MDEEVAAQVLQGLLRDGGHDPVRDGLEKIRKQEGGEHEEGRPQEARNIAAADALVYGHPHEVGTGKAEEGEEEDVEDDEAHGFPVGSQIAHEP